MEDIRMKEMNLKNEQKRKILNRIFYIKKNWWKFLLILLSISFLLFPSFFGTLIGNWINDFFGSIIKNINF